MERIKELRKEKGLTQAELAKLIGVNPVTLSRYETGDRKPKIDKLEKMAEIFGVTPSYITGLTDLKFDKKLLELLKKANSPKSKPYKPNDFELLTFGEDEYYLLVDYRSLNSEGKKQASKQVSDLTKINDYKKKK